MEQELASIIKLVLDSTGHPNPYYEHIPERFSIPSAYFPQPEVIGGGDTLCTYRLDFTWYIVFRAATQADAYEMAFRALVEILTRNYKVPLIDETGQETQRSIRMNGIRANGLDQCRAQLTISWTSHRVFRKAARIASLEKVLNFIRDWVNDPDIYLTRTIDSAVERVDSSRYDIDLIMASNDDGNLSGVKPDAAAIAATVFAVAETATIVHGATTDHDASGTKPDQVLVGDTVSAEILAQQSVEDIIEDHICASEDTGSESGLKPMPTTIGSHSVSEATSGYTEVTTQVQSITCGTAKAHQ